MKGFNWKFVFVFLVLALVSVLFADKPDVLVPLAFGMAAISVRREDIPDLKLDFGLYTQRENNRKLSFVEVLEKLERDKGFVPNAELASVSDAWSRQVYKAGINLKSSATLVESFFTSNDNKVLFPEYIRRKIEEGMKFDKRQLNLPDIYAIKTELDGNSDKQQILKFDENDTKLKLIAQGSEMPTVTVLDGEAAISLFKAGRKVVFTYESIRRSSLLRIGLFFSEIGKRIGRQIVRRGLEVMKDGDGNNNACTPVETATTTWKYDDLLQLLYGDFSDGYEASHIVMNKKMFMKIFTDKTNFAQMQSPGILEKFLRTGEQEDLLGVVWKLHNDIPDETIYAYNKNLCLEYYEEKGSSIVETDRIISNQTEIGTISRNLNFGILDAKARVIKVKKA
jgi:hypothetical protein